MALFLRNLKNNFEFQNTQLHTNINGVSSIQFGRNRKIFVCICFNELLLKAKHSLMANYTYMQPECVTRNAKGK